VYLNLFLAVEKAIPPFSCETTPLLLVKTTFRLVFILPFSSHPFGCFARAGGKEKGRLLVSTRRGKAKQWNKQAKSISSFKGPI
jgi:hypothetical protein